MCCTTCKSSNQPNENCYYSKHVIARYVLNSGILTCLFLCFLSNKQNLGGGGAGPLLTQGLLDCLLMLIIILAACPLQPFFVGIHIFRVGPLRITAVPP